jgi:2,4-dichlorophenol 6-monooxygenase
MEVKDYEFDAHGVDLGQFYESAAIVLDGSERPQPACFWFAPTSTSAGAR